MFGGSLFGNDPFFSAHMQQIDRMMQDPFGSMGMMGMPSMGRPMLEAGHERQRDMAQRSSRQRDVMPRHAMMDPFGTHSMFSSMFQNMNSMMSNMHCVMERGANDPNAQFISHSSVMSYRNTGEGPAKVFQASSSSRQGPGGLRETRKSVRDSEAAIEKMSVGRYLGEQGHVEERKRDMRSGDMEENQEYINLDEEELPTFNSEWRERNTSLQQARIGQPQRNQARAITNGRPRASKKHSSSRKEGRKNQEGDRYDRLGERYDKDKYSGGQSNANRGY